MPRVKEYLELYKRHSPACPVHQIKPKPNNIKFFFDCDCYVWIVGRTPNGDIVPRQSAGVKDLKKAEQIRSSYLRAAKADPAKSDVIAECVIHHLATKKRGMGFCPKHLRVGAVCFLVF